MHQKCLHLVLLIGIISREGSSCVDPAPATNITVKNLNSDSELFVTWTETVGTVDYYNVILEGDITKTTQTNSTQMTFSQLLPGREYTITVQTVSENCSSAAPPVTEATCPSQPGPLIYRYNVTNNISLAWEEPANMANVPKQFNITVQNQSTLDTWSVLSNIPAINLTGLPNGCDYVFTIMTVGVRQYKSSLQTDYVHLAYDAIAEYSINSAFYSSDGWIEVITDAPTTLTTSPPNLPGLTTTQPIYTVTFSTTDTQPVTSINPGDSTMFTILTTISPIFADPTTTQPIYTTTHSTTNINSIVSDNPGDSTTSSIPTTTPPNPATTTTAQSIYTTTFSTTDSEPFVSDNPGDSTMSNVPTTTPPNPATTTTAQSIYTTTFSTTDSGPFVSDNTGDSTMSNVPTTTPTIHTTSTSIPFNTTTSSATARITNSFTTKLPTTSPLPIPTTNSKDTYLPTFYVTTTTSQTTNSPPTNFSTTSISTTITTKSPVLITTPSIPSAPSVTSIASTTSKKSSIVPGSDSTALPGVISNPNLTDQLVVNWMPAPGNVDHYIVTLGNEIKQVNANTTTATFTGLTPGTEYRIVVEAVIGNSRSVITNVTQATYPSTPGPPSNPYVAPGMVYIVWEEPAGMTHVQKSFKITVEKYNTRSLMTIVNNTPAAYVSDLPAGKYNFTIVTVGALEYTSIPMTTNVDVPSKTQTETGVIVGAVVGSIAGVIVLAIIGFIIWKFVRRREAKLGDYNVRMHIMKSEDFTATFEPIEKNYMMLTKEFANLQCVGALLSRSTATHPANADKNHPEAIYPYDKSLVKLTNAENSSNGYINASYIPGQKSQKEFIVAQSPLPETFSDFWHMIWEQHITTIVILSSSGANEPEDGEEYWPLIESRLFCNLLVTFVKENSNRDWTFREFILMDVKKKKHFLIQQFQYKVWQVDEDNTVRESLLEFVYEVMRHKKEYPVNYPTLVHSSTGGSRCGIFIALNRIITQLGDSNSVNVYGTVHDLLLHRPSMIQSKDEYVFLHHCTLDIIKIMDQRKSQNLPDEHYARIIEPFPSRAQDSEHIYASTYDIGLLRN